MNSLLKNGIGVWPPSYSIKPINVLIDGDTIVQVSQEPIKVAPDTQVYDLKGNLLLPGFVDCHTHLAQSFGRGIYDNLHLTEWLLARSWDEPMNEEEVYAASMIGALEALRTGTTTVAEMTTVGELGDIAIEAIVSSGLRAVVSIPMGDYQEGKKRPPKLNTAQCLEATRKTFERWHGAVDGRITMRVSPVGLPACTEELMRGCRALADELGVGIHTHCCEGETETANSYERFGVSEVELLHRCGVLGPDAQLVHCIWLSERDKQLIAETGSHVITCPSTNTKITDGMPPMPDLHKLGVNIGIGCDGAASSGSYDMLQEARLVSLLGKVRTMDAAMFPAEEVYQMMTANGSRAIGLGDQVGGVEPGRKADIIVISYPKIHLIDERRLLSNLIYSATGGDVDSVFVGGKPLIWQGEMMHLDEEEIIARALELMRNWNTYY